MSKRIVAEPKFSLVKMDTVDRETWDDFLARYSQGNLLQSYAWGDFKHLMGDTVLRYGLTHRQELVAVAQIIIHSRLIGGATASLPRGPVMAGATPKLMLYFVQQLTRICTEQHATDLIVEPELAGIPADAWRQLRFAPTSAVQPAHTTRVDLATPDLIGSFKPKTRYNIRLAEKKDVQISASTERDGLRDFYRLLTVTALRQNVHFYTLDYYQTLYDTFGPSGDLVILTASHDGDAIASLLLIFCQDTAYYLYGGTDDQKRDLMANYLLHYQAMELAREKGCHWYDFWGVALAGDPLADKWAGITRFKMGFNGSLVEYPPAYRRIFKPFWPRLRSLASWLRHLPSLVRPKTA